MTEQSDIGECVRLVETCKTSLTDCNPRQVIGSIAFLNMSPVAVFETIDDNFLGGLMEIASSSKQHQAWRLLHETDAFFLEMFEGPTAAQLPMTCMVRCLKANVTLIPLFKYLGRYGLMKEWLDKYERNDHLIVVFTEFVISISNEYSVGKDLVKMGAFNHLLKLSGRDERVQFRMLHAFQGIIVAVGWKAIRKYDFVCSHDSLAVILNNIIATNSPDNERKILSLDALTHLMAKDDTLQAMCKPEFLDPIIVMCTEITREEDNVVGTNDSSQENVEGSEKAILLGRMMHLLYLLAASADESFARKLLILIPRLLDILSKNDNERIKGATLEAVFAWSRFDFVCEEVYRCGGIVMLQRLITGSTDPFSPEHLLALNCLRILNLVLRIFADRVFSQEDFTAIDLVLTTVARWLDNSLNKHQQNTEHILAMLAFLDTCFCLEFGGHPHIRLEVLSGWCCQLGNLGIPVLGLLAIGYEIVDFTNIPQHCQLRRKMVMEMHTTVLKINTYLKSLPTERLEALSDDMRWVRAICQHVQALHTNYQQIARDLIANGDSNRISSADGTDDLEGIAVATGGGGASLASGASGTGDPDNFEGIDGVTGGSGGRASSDGAADSAEGIGGPVAAHAVASSPAPIRANSTLSDPKFCSARGCTEALGLKKCARCLQVSYCSQSCQHRDWKLVHKRICGKKKEQISAVLQRVVGTQKLQILNQPLRIGLMKEAWDLIWEKALELRERLHQRSDATASAIAGGLLSLPPLSLPLLLVQVMLPLLLAILVLLLLLLLIANLHQAYEDRWFSS